MKEDQSTGFYILMAVFALAGIGLVTVYSSSMYWSMSRFGNGTYFFFKHLTHLIAGFVVLFLLSRINYRWYSKISSALMVIGYVLLAILLWQKFTGSGGAHRWLRVAGIGFQPSEFMKLFMIIYISTILTRLGDRVRDFKTGFLPLLCLIASVFFLVVFQTDLGMAVLLGGIGLYLLFIGRAKLLHITLLLVITISAALTAIDTVPYMNRRWQSFINPGEHAYQINQSRIGLGSGGLLGLGLGKSTQKFLFLPERHTDFIFAIFGEEWGFLGTTVFMALALFFVNCGFRTARGSPDIFGFFLASGISAMFGFQILINIGVSIGVLPTTGMTLPFISYGGSSLVLSFAAAGILLNISRQANQAGNLKKELNTRVKRRSAWI